MIKQDYALHSTEVHQLQRCKFDLYRTFTVDGLAAKLNTLIDSVVVGLIAMHVVSILERLFNYPHKM